MALSIGLAVGYVALFALTFLRRGRSGSAKWMAGYLAGSAMLSVLSGLSREPSGSSEMWPPGVLLVLSNLLTLSLLGAVTFEYLNRPRSWVWPALGVASALTVILGAEFEPPSGLFDHSQFGWLTGGGPTVAGLAVAFLWVLAAVAQMTFVVVSLGQARLPLHANRILFWAFAMPVVILGGATGAWGAGGLANVGEAVRFLGVAALTYAVLSPRLIDVRHMARRAIGQVTLLFVTALITLVAIELADAVLSDLPSVERWAGVAALALSVAFIHQLLRGLTEQMVTQLILRAGHDTTRITRQFSERIASLLDVPELAHSAGETFRAVFGASRSSLLLLTPAQDGTVTVAPIPGHGKNSDRPTELSADNPVLTALTLKRQPLLQYDVDTDPIFRAMSDEAAGWFQALRVDVYVPVRDGTTLSAIFAVGPKASGDPYRKEELDILATLADQTGVALKNSRLFTDLRTLNEEMASLNRHLQESNETLAKMDKVKTDFISIASHELRTPLTQLRGYADVLGAMAGQSQLNPEMLANIVESIKRASDRLNAVYGQMLDSSQLDVNALDLKLVDTTLEAILRLAVEPYAKAMRERKQTLTAQGVRSLPPIRGDFQRLVQAFGQIVGNAVKFTPDGGRIDIAARPLTPDPGQPASVEVVVADSGIGIDPKFHPLIFEKFFRIGSTSVHSTGTTKFMGAGPGLGLTIAKGIVERHGGKVWVESPGQDLKSFPGSCFHVVLPLSPPAFTPDQAAALLQG